MIQKRQNIKDKKIKLEHLLILIEFNLKLIELINIKNYLTFYELFIH